MLLQVLVLATKYDSCKLAFCVGFSARGSQKRNEMEKEEKKMRVRAVAQTVKSYWCEIEYIVNY